MDKRKVKTTYTCNVCNKTFGRKDSLNRHILRHISLDQHNCQDCGKVFSRPDALAVHQRRYHPQKGSGAKRKHEEEDGSMPAPKMLKENPKMFYNLEKIREKKIAKFKTTNTVYRANVKDLEVSDVTEILKALKVIFNSIIEDITGFSKDQDLIRMSVESRELDYPIQIPFLRKKRSYSREFLVRNRTSSSIV